MMLDGLGEQSVIAATLLMPLRASNMVTFQMTTELIDQLVGWLID